MGEYHFVLQNADWAGDVKDRRSHSGISVWIKNSDEKFGYLVQFNLLEDLSCARTAQQL